MTDTDEAVERAAKPFTAYDLAEKQRYVNGRNVARSHWSAAELAHIDHEARWLATLAAADGGEVERLRAEIERMRRACHHNSEVQGEGGTLTCELCGHVGYDPFWRNPV